MVEERFTATRGGHFSQNILNMCLYPRLIQNPKYKPNKKNGGHPPKPKDKRLNAVAIGCGKCIECRKQKANEWRVRLSEEIKHRQYKYFVTLTFSQENLEKYEYLAAEKNGGEIEENEVATIAIRRFLERWRKLYGESTKHWLITELGHDNTERLHLHGIIFTTPQKIRNLEKIWGNGWVHIGTYCNTKTINYIVKYVTKIDNDHKEFNGKILCSPGIGDNYFTNGKKGKERKTEIPILNTYNKTNTREYYKLPNGQKTSLPIYYRNNIWTENQREQLWLNRMDEGKIYVMGTAYDITTEKGRQTYIKALKTAQKNNIKNGYGKIEWKAKDYQKSLKYSNQFH